MEQITIKGFKGVNQAIDPELLEPTELATWENVVINNAGGGNSIIRRGGFARINTHTVSGKMISLHDVRDALGTNFMLATVGTTLKMSTSG